jgi:uncharacterized protein YcbX
VLPPAGTKAGLPRLAGLRLHPIKSLDGVSVSEARIGPGGGLEHDRAWALYSVDGRWVNAKRTAAMHLIRASYAPDLTSVTFPDDNIANGPTIVSTASLQTVSDWFPGLTLDAVRQRFRTTLEIDSADFAGSATGSQSAAKAASSNGHLPAFWEDQLYGEDERSVVRFRIGGVNFEGSNPCARCPVPARDPQTAADLVGFQKRFTDLRRETLPPWAPAARFDHFYRLAVNTRIAPTETGKPLRLGDSLKLS